MRKTVTALTLLLLMTLAAHARQAGGEWVKFTPTEGYFSVLLPGKPEELMSGHIFKPCDCNA